MTSPLPKRYFDAAKVHEAIAVRTELNMAQIRAACKRMGLTPEVLRKYMENPDY